MKKLMIPAMSLLAMAMMLAPSTSRAEVLFEDDFDGPAGEKLIQREPNVINKGSAMYLGHAQLLLNESKQVVASQGSGAVSLPLPEIKAGDVITLTATVRVAGESVTWIGIGFTEEPQTLSSYGQITAAVRADGAGRVFTGAQKDGFLLYKEKDNIASSAANVTEPVRLQMSFDTGKFKLSVKVDDSVIYDGPVDYMTQEKLRYATFELVRQNDATSASPGYCDDFKVEVSKP